MNGSQDRQNNLVDITDCLEAIEVCKGWKTFLFVVMAICLLLLQTSFWLVNTGYVKVETMEADLLEAVKPLIITPPALIEEAAEKIAAEEPNESGETPKSREIHFSFDLKLTHLNLVIRFCNFVLIFAAMLYCLTMLFSFKVSLIGRLGGINHICRAFFISLVMVIFLLPWQKFFGNIVVGAVFTSEELVSWCAAKSNNIFGAAIHYLRFTVYWLLIVLLLIFSHLRSSRWSKAVLRRLEIL